MINSPSRYAHLPTKEDDYKFIISKIEDGMYVQQVDEIIAELKFKKEIEHHYRTNLKNLGLFTYDNSKGRKTITLNKNVYLFKKNVITLKELLKIIIENNEEIMYIKMLAEKNNIFDFQLEKLATVLNNQFPNRKLSNMLRWVRPISFLLIYVYTDRKNYENDITNIESLYKELLKEIQKDYFNIATEYGDPVAIEEIEKQIINKYPQVNIEIMWSKIYSDENLEYKLSFITFPSWFTLYKPIIINNKVFTHIRIKKNIIGGEE